jgi:uncharacterized membrane protein YwaF
MSCIVLFQKISEDCFTCLFFVRVAAFMAVMNMDLGMDTLFSNYHYTAFTDR